MVLKTYAIDLYHYNDWANRKIINALSEMNEVPTRAMQIIAHIIAAQKIWLNRILSINETLPVWPGYSLAECKQLSEESTADWLQYLDSLEEEDLPKTFIYHNSTGGAFEPVLQDIICHVANHSTHHRGQIILLIRQQGIDPPKTDHLFFKRFP